MITVNRLCCMRLHTAGVVVGWVGAALSFANIVIYAVILSRLDQVVDFIINNKFAGPGSTEDLKTITVAGVAICLMLCLVNLISSVLLIAGTMKKCHLMLVPWLINSGFVLIINILNFIFIMGYSTYNNQPFASTFGMMIVLGLVLGIQYLIWTAIYSLFRDIRSSRGQEQLISNKDPSYTRI